MNGDKQMHNTNMRKKMMKNIRTWVALLIASVTLAACSSDDNAIQNAQSAAPSGEPQVYTMTVQATKGDGSAATRGLNYGSDGALNANWFEGEEVEVIQASMAAPMNPTSIGTLKAKASSTGTTTLTGTLTGLEKGKVLMFFLHNHIFNYEGQTGALLKSQGKNSIEEKYDFAFVNENVEDYTVSGSTVTMNRTLTFESMQSIVKFTLMDESGKPLNAKSLKIECKNYLFENLDILNPTNSHFTKKLTITPATPTSVIYAAICNSNPSVANDYTLTATSADGKEYTYIKTGVRFTEGKYYEITVKTSSIKGHALSEAVVGEIVGSNGMAYSLADKDKLPSGGVTAVAMVAYVGSESDCSHGLALALADEGGPKTWSDAMAVCSGKTAVKGCTWRLPSLNDWEHMFSGCGGSGSFSSNPSQKIMTYTELANKLYEAAGAGAAMYTGKEDSFYWTSTKIETEKGVFYSCPWFDSNGKATGAFAYQDSDVVTHYVRACLAF